MMRKLLVLLLFSFAGLAHAQAASNRLTWTDMSSNETQFIIERKIASAVDQCAVASPIVFTQIATTGPNIQTFIDPNLIEGTTYCYRVMATGPGGPSGYSNIAGRLVPFTATVAPSALGVTGGP